MSTIRDIPPELLPPMDLDAESALLGSIMLGGLDVWASVATIVGESDMFAEANRAIWRGIATLAGRGAIDGMLLRAELERTGTLDDAGGIDYLMQILNAVPTPVHAEHYARIVRRHALARECIRIGNHLATLAHDRHREPEEIIHRAAAALTRLTAAGRAREIQPIADALRQYHASLTDGTTSLIPFGFMDLDALLGGMGIGEITLIPARPSMGKSTIARQIAAKAACRGTPTLIVSREESRQKIARNFLSRECAIENKRLRRRELSVAERDRIAAAPDQWASLPLYLVDAARTAEDIRSVVAAAVARHAVQLVVIDYLQLIDAGGRTDTERAGLASRFCRDLVQEFPVALLCPTQLNRAVEHRDDKRPTLADLRDSGQIEQDADLVLMLHREDYYHAHDPDYQPTYEAEVLIAKARDAGRGENVTLRSDLRYQRFDDLVRCPPDDLSPAPTRQRAPDVVQLF